MPWALDSPRALGGCLTARLACQHYQKDAGEKKGKILFVSERGMQLTVDHKGLKYSESLAPLVLAHLSVEE